MNHIDKKKRYGFWMRYSFKEGTDKQQKDTFIDNLGELIRKLHCTGMGGALHPWDWQEFVFAHDKFSATKSDRERVKQFFEKQKILKDYAIGEFVRSEKNERRALEVVKRSIIEHFTNLEIN
jgi:uncharacterized protein YggL (DUF469 family)